VVRVTDVLVNKAERSLPVGVHGAHIAVAVEQHNRVAAVDRQLAYGRRHSAGLEHQHAFPIDRPAHDVGTSIGRWRQEPRLAARKREQGDALVDGPRNWFDRDGTGHPLAAHGDIRAP